MTLHAVPAPCDQHLRLKFVGTGGIVLSAVRLILYIVYDQSVYTSSGIVEVEYDNKSMGLFDLIITFSFPLNLTFQRSYTHPKNLSQSLLSSIHLR